MLGSPRDCTHGYGGTAGQARIAKRIAWANTLEAVAEEFIAKLEAEGRAEITVDKAHLLLSKLSPSLGKRTIAEITPHESLAVL